jgi:hypothetical protein
MSVTSDGTQLFGIPDSPITLGAVTYIGEDLTVSIDAQVVEIKDANGLTIGQTIVPGNAKGTGKLQLAATTTVAPAIGASFTLTATAAAGTYLITSVGETYTAGAYAYVNIGFSKKINA